MADVTWVVFAVRPESKAADVARNPARWRDHVRELGRLEAANLTAANRQAAERWPGVCFFVKSALSLDSEESLPAPPPRPILST